MYRLLIFDNHVMEGVSIDSNTFCLLSALQVESLWAGYEKRQILLDTETETDFSIFMLTFVFIQQLWFILCMAIFTSNLSITLYTVNSAQWVGSMLPYHHVLPW